MKIQPTNYIYVLLCLFLGVSAHANSSYKSLEDNPAEEGSPAAVFLLFAKACNSKDIDQMKKHTKSTFRMMLDNSPTAVDFFHNLFGGIDYERQILYRELPHGEGKVRLKLRYFKVGKDKLENLDISLVNDGGNWKVTS